MTLPKLPKSIEGDQVQCLRPATSQTVSIGGSSQASSAFAAGVLVVRLIATNNCHIQFGSSPTAVANGTDLFLPSFIPEYFRVEDQEQVAVIQDSASGTLHITEMN